MGVKIRLTRVGTKKKSFYRVVVAHSDAPRDGRFIEQLGTYDPGKDPAVIHLDSEKVERWVSRGAQPTRIVTQLIKRAKAASSSLSQT